jgi:hypothetical protein
MAMSHALYKFWTLILDPIRPQPPFDLGKAPFEAEKVQEAVSGWKQGDTCGKGGTPSLTSRRPCNCNSSVVVHNAILYGASQA